MSFDERVVPYLQRVLAHDRIRYVREPVGVEVEALDVHLDPVAADGVVLLPEGNLVADLEAEFGA